MLSSVEDWFGLTTTFVAITPEKMKQWKNYVGITSSRPGFLNGWVATRQGVVADLDIIDCTFPLNKQAYEL